jgi:hypothetical protein
LRGGEFACHRYDSCCRRLDGDRPVRARAIVFAAHSSEVPMIAVVWQFDVKTGQETQFEEFLGAEGEWTKISRQARSYLGSSFLRDQNQPARYLLIEYWSELVVSEKYRKYRSNAIAALERRRTATVAAVEAMGVFTALNVPERTGPTWTQQSKSASLRGKRAKS